MQEMRKAPTKFEKTKQQLRSDARTLALRRVADWVLFRLLELDMPFVTQALSFIICL